MSTAAAAAIGAAVQTGLDLASSSIKNKKTYKYSKKLMDYQNKLNIENWNMVNEYNSPLNQRKRNLQAGINPNFGDGSIAQQIASPSAQMDADFPNLGSSLMQGAQLGLSIKQQKENIIQTKEQTKKIKTDERLVKAQAINQELQNEFDAEYGSTMRSAQLSGQHASNANLIASAIASLANGDASTAMAQLTRLRQSIEGYRYKDLRDSEIENIQSKTNLQDTSAINDTARVGIEQGNLDLGRARLNLDQQEFAWKKNYENRMANLQSLATYYLGTLQMAQTDLTKSQTTQQDYLNGITKFDADLREYLATTGMDKTRERYTNYQLSQNLDKTKAEIKKLYADRKLSEQQRIESVNRVIDNHINAACNIGNTIINGYNALNPWTTVKEFTNSKVTTTYKR